MTVAEWLKKSVAKLKDSGIPTPLLDAEILLATELKKDRSWLHSHGDNVLQGATLQRLDDQISRRCEHEPIAYIRGKSEFYGREFIVSSDTLQPRPETETLIEMLKAVSPLKILDIGTGSGCIAITAKLELPASEVTACDISISCLKIAKLNSEILNADIEIVESDLLQDINVKKLSEATICCNLPYVPDDFVINTAASHEPDIALFGGKDGLDYYRQLFEQIISLPAQFKPQIVLTESMPNQHEALSAIAKQADYSLSLTSDFIQQFEYSI